MSQTKSLRPAEPLTRREAISAPEALRHMERTGWLVMWIAFGVFLALAVSLPLAGRWYLQNATRAETAEFTKIGGTPVVYLPEGGAPSAILDALEVREGYTFVTDPSSGGELDFSPVANASLQVYANSRLTVERMRSPRFGASSRPNEIVLHHEQGRIKVEDLGRLGRDLRWVVETPHGRVLLEPDGSYVIEVSNDQTEVVARRGRADLVAGESTVRVFADRRGVIRLGQEPEGPLAASRNLVVNGDLQSALGGAWLASFCEGSPCIAQEGGVVVIEESGRRAASFSRSGAAGGPHGENRITQIIDRDISEARSLELIMDVKIDHQSLGGCGTLSSECPIIAKIVYRDQYGSTAEWLTGFYYRDPPGQYLLNPEFRKVTQGAWGTYQSGNLVEEAQYRPHYIERIEVYASGWDYQAYVANVQLLIE